MSNQKLKDEIEDLKNQNKEHSDKLLQSDTKSTRTTAKGSASTSIPTSRSTSVDLSWDEEGRWKEMPEDEDPFVKSNWRFQQDYFKDIPYHVLELLSLSLSLSLSLDEYKIA